MKRAVFPGSFDPITLGHLDIIERSIPLFDEIIVGVGTNSEKKYMFPLKKRMAFIEETFSKYKSISVNQYEGLTIKFCKKVQANFIIRGLRNLLISNLKRPLPTPTENCPESRQFFYSLRPKPLLSAAV